MANTNVVSRQSSQFLDTQIIKMNHLNYIRNEFQHLTNQPKKKSNQNKNIFTLI